MDDLETLCRFKEKQNTWGSKKGKRPTSYKTRDTKIGRKVLCLCEGEIGEEIFPFPKEYPSTFVVLCHSTLKTYSGERMF